MDLPAPPPDDALAQPTRARLFALLTELRRPAGTEQLAARLGLHPNGVRIHLERLHGEGLIERERTRQARGRPRDMWTIAPDARPGGAAPSGYEQLGRWLARALASSRTSARTVEATGREIGRELAPAGNSGPPERRMHAALAALGFQPQREPSPPAGMTYRLCNCPYREAASENPEVVCGMHRGVTRGLLEVIAPTTKLTGFLPNDPYEAGCRIELTGGLNSEGRAEERQPA
jgi:predicted ArsR family transcriptional regulator